MEESAKCPICGKEGIPDFRKEDVVCPCCGTDLSIYNRLREVTEIPSDNKLKGKRKRLLPGVLIVFVITSFVGFGCFELYESTIKQKSLPGKEAEIAELKKEISLLQDSIRQINQFSIKSSAEMDSPSYRLYIVKRGDCIRRISFRQLGTEQRFHEIESLNNLTVDAIIHPGDTLKIPRK